MNMDLKAEDFTKRWNHVQNRLCMKQTQIIWQLEIDNENPCELCGNHKWDHKLHPMAGFPIEIGRSRRVDILKGFKGSYNIDTSMFWRLKKFNSHPAVSVRGAKMKTDPKMLLEERINDHLLSWSHLWAGLDLAFKQANLRSLPTWGKFCEHHLNGNLELVLT